MASPAAIVVRSLGPGIGNITIDSNAEGCRGTGAKGIDGSDFDSRNTSAGGGVPSKVKVVALKLSQAGKGPPSLMET